MARSLLNEQRLPKYFWGEAHACYIVNRRFLRAYINKTSYELWFDKIPNISHLKVFGCKYYILNTKDILGKFDSKIDDGLFLCFSLFLGFSSK